MCKVRLNNNQKRVCEKLFQIGRTKSALTQRVWMANCEGFSTFAAINKQDE